MAVIISTIDKAKEYLYNEDVVGIPTETVYGLAGNIYSEKAIRRIFEIKKRPLFNPLIVHIPILNDLHKVAVGVPEMAIKLANAFWPGPLTLVLKKHSSVPDIVSGGKNTIAVRVPNHPVALSLLSAIDFPLAAPSANPFGAISPTCAEHVAGYFKKELKIILDGGICERGIESTIIGFQNTQPVLYRAGSIAADEIEMVVGKLIMVTKNETSPEAPGMLSKHYAPKTTTIFTNDVVALINKFADRKIGLLLFQHELPCNNMIQQEVLSRAGDLKEAASNLYGALHRLDRCKLDIIVAERFPNQGLGITINDRLKRAATR